MKMGEKWVNIVVDKDYKVSYNIRMRLRAEQTTHYATIGEHDMTDKLTDNQKKSLLIIQKELKATGVSVHKAFRKHFFNALKEANIRAPWALFDTVKAKDDSFDFQKLFDLHLDDKEITMPESFPLPDTITVEPTDDPLDDAPVEDKRDYDTKVLEKITSRPAGNKDTSDDAPPLKIKEHVFLVEASDTTEETHVVGIASSFRSAYEKLVYFGLHGKPSISVQEARKIIDEKGVVLLKTKQINRVCCVISKQELV